MTLDDIPSGISEDGGLIFEVFDSCIRCGEDTPYRPSTPVDQRKFYIEGAGQLCGSCHLEVYSNPDGNPDGNR